MVDDIALQTLERIGDLGRRADHAIFASHEVIRAVGSSLITGFVGAANSTEVAFGVIERGLAHLRGNDIGVEAAEVLFQRLGRRVFSRDAAADIVRTLGTIGRNAVLVDTLRLWRGGVTNLHSRRAVTHIRQHEAIVEAHRASWHGSHRKHFSITASHIEGRTLIGNGHSIGIHTANTREIAGIASRETRTLRGEHGISIQTILALRDGNGR